VRAVIALNSREFISTFFSHNIFFDQRGPAPDFVWENHASDCPYAGNGPGVSLLPESLCFLTLICHYLGKIITLSLVLLRFGVNSIFSDAVSSHTGLIKTGRLFSECVREVNENLRLNWI